MQLLIISGLSGSGKSVALHMLEDLDYYCIDNMPAAMLNGFVRDTMRGGDPHYERVAVSVDARNHPSDILSLPELVEELQRDGIQCEILFLHAEDDVLLKRYSETRRRHPLTRDGLGLREAIAKERALLDPIAMHAQFIIDTSHTGVHDLRELIRGRVEASAERRLALMFQSFGYKNGIPSDADFVFDVRCLPNPYWAPSLRALNGKDAPVIEFLEKDQAVTRMLQDMIGFLERWLPAFERSNRSYVTVAIGCTGGQHRSVYLSERLAEHFAPHYARSSTRHTDLRSSG